MKRDTVNYTLVGAVVAVALVVLLVGLALITGRSGPLVGCLLLLPVPRRGIAVAEAEVQVRETEVPEVLCELIDMPPHQVDGFRAIGLDGERQRTILSGERHPYPSEFLRRQRQFDGPVGKRRNGFRETLAETGRKGR